MVPFALSTKYTIKHTHIINTINDNMHATRSARLVFFSTLTKYVGNGRSKMKKKVKYMYITYFLYILKIMQAIYENYNFKNIIIKL